MQSEHNGTLKRISTILIKINGLSSNKKGNDFISGNN